MEYSLKMRPLLFVVLLGIAAASQSELTLVRTTALQGNTHHVQGIDFDERHLWVTSVNKDLRKGYLQEFSLSAGEPLRTIDVTAGIRFHPGGMSADGASLWLPVAEYRRASSSVIQKRNLRTLELEYQFDVADHIGCIAATPEVLIGANWDSRDFYIWDRKGQLLRKISNPTPNAYQDLKFVDGQLVASGLLPGRNGAIDWLDYPAFHLVRRVTVGQTSRGVPYTSEGMAVRGDQLYLLPEDSPSRLFQFHLETPARSKKQE
jgi:hypothetical protein